MTIPQTAVQRLESLNVAREGKESEQNQEEEQDDSIDDYQKFLEATDKHRRIRDGKPKEQKFDFRTDSISDSMLEPGLAAIEQDFEQTKREMEQLYGAALALRVHSQETKVRINPGKPQVHSGYNKVPWSLLARGNYQYIEC